jgi:hypothetical protein
MAKWNGTNVRSFILGTTVSGTQVFYGYLGHTSGTAWEIYYDDDTISTGIWYHVGWHYKDSTKTWTFRIWDDNAGALLGSGNETGTVSNNVSITTAPLWVGWTPNTSIGGTIDELYIFGDILSNAEIDACRAGTHDYASDSDCYAYWSFDNPRVADQIGGNHIHQASPTVQVPATHDGADYKEGSYCCDFDGANQMWYSDPASSLDSDFPFRTADTNKKCSVCFWYKPETFTIDRSVLQFGDDGTSDASFAAMLDENAGSTYFALYTGHTGGGTWEMDSHASALSTGVWYHVGMTFDDSDGSYRIRVWDDNAGAILGSDLTGTKSNSVNVEDATVSLAGISGPAVRLDGRLDEVVVFKDVLTADEIDKIRGGNYGAGGPQMIIITKELETDWLNLY